MDVTVVVGTFGEEQWPKLARQRAIASVPQGIPVVHFHSELTDYAEALCEARNEGAKQADTEWLCFLDADDELLPGYFEAMEKATADLRTPKVQYVRPGRAPDRPMFWPEIPIWQGNWIIVSTLVRRSLFFDVGAFRPWLLYEDWDLWQRCVIAGATIEQVEDAICRCHISTGSIHRHGSTRQQKNAAHHQIVKANYPRHAA